MVIFLSRYSWLFCWCSSGSWGTMLYNPVCWPWIPYVTKGSLEPLILLHLASQLLRLFAFLQMHLVKVWFIFLGKSLSVRNTNFTAEVETVLSNVLNSYGSLTTTKQNKCKKKRYFIYKSNSHLMPSCFYDQQSGHGSS